MTDPVPVIIPPVTPGTKCDAVWQEIVKYDWDHRVAMAIAQAENRKCDPLTHNETASETHRRADGSVICVGSYGVIQVGCLHYREGEDVNDLATNMKVAHRAYVARATWDSTGFNAWTMYKNGEYRQFL